MFISCKRPTQGSKSEDEKKQWKRPVVSIAYFHFFILCIRKHSIDLCLYRMNLWFCYGFTWQDFGSRGATGVTSVSSCEKLPSCLTKPVLGGSKTDPLLARTKPISDGGNASVITYLRRGRKKTVVKRQLEREE